MLLYFVLLSTNKYLWLHHTHMLAVIFNWTLCLFTPSFRYGSPHHSRSQSVKTPGSRASGRPNQLCLPQQRSRYLFPDQEQNNEDEHEEVVKGKLFLSWLTKWNVYRSFFRVIHASPSTLYSLPGKCLDAFCFQRFREKKPFV